MKKKTKCLFTRSPSVQGRKNSFWNSKNLLEYEEKNLMVYLPNVPVFRVGVVAWILLSLVIAEGGEQLRPLAAPVAEDLRLKQLQPHDREVDRFTKLPVKKYVDDSL